MGLNVNPPSLQPFFFFFFFFWKTAYSTTSDTTIIFQPNPDVENNNSKVTDRVPTLTPHTCFLISFAFALKFTRCHEAKLQRVKKNAYTVVYLILRVLRVTCISSSRTSAHHSNTGTR